MRLNSTSIHRSLTSCKDVISDAGHRLTLSKARRNKRGVMLGNPMEGGRIHCPVLFFFSKRCCYSLKDPVERKIKRRRQLIFHSWTCAHKKLGIFMKHNCVQMLIFKQRSIRCTSFGYSTPLALMKSLARAEGEAIAARLWARLNGRDAHDLAHLAPVQHLGQVSGVKHRPSKTPLQAGYP